MKKQFYIFCGTNPLDWCESEALGPFESESQAHKAIKEDIQSCLEGTEMLALGRLEDWCERYHVMEYKKGVKPVLNVSVDISLPKLKSKD